MVGVQQETKNSTRAKRVSRILETLRQGTVIVEGLHDVKTLNLLGVNAVSYSQLCAGTLPSAGERIYILTDSDRGGEEKKAKIEALLLEANGNYVMDDSLGRRMLRILNATSVEQVYGPVEEILMKGKNEGKRKG